MSYVSDAAYRFLVDSIYNQDIPQAARDYLVTQMAIPTAEETTFRNALATVRNPAATIQQRRAALDTMIAIAKS